MKRRNTHRTAALTGIALAISALPLVMATPAHATSAQCEDVLIRAGYVIGEKARSACRSNPIGTFRCETILNALDVKENVVRTACSYAPRW